MGENPLNTNPHILAVAFSQTDGDYRLVLSNHTLIPRRENPSMGDPFNGMAAGGVEDCTRRAADHARPFFQLR